MKEILFKILPYLLPGLSLAYALTIYCLARGKRKVKAKLTEQEQREDLYNFMVKTIKKTEAFSLMVSFVNKQDKSAWKQNEVLDKMLMYANGCGYRWYDNCVGTAMINEYINDANIASGKRKS